jgi:hypothetical protein
MRPIKLNWIRVLRPRWTPRPWTEEPREAAVVGGISARTFAIEVAATRPNSFVLRRRVPGAWGPPKGLMRHEHRQGLLMHEVEGHPSEQPFEKPRNGARSETARRAKA